MHGDLRRKGLRLKRCSFEALANPASQTTCMPEELGPSLLELQIEGKHFP